MDYGKWIDRLFSVNPTVKSLLKDAPNPHVARNLLRAYVDEMMHMLNKSSQKIQPLEWELQMRCLHTFKKLISVRSERLSKFGLTKLLWLLANDSEELPETLNEGFFEEMYRLFLGIQGRSGIYDEAQFPEFANKTGREAARIRSDQLDKLAQKSHQYIKRYPTGLDEEIIEIRRKNRDRILKFFNATPDDWNDYLWHIRHVIRDADQLAKLIHLTPEEEEGIRRAREYRIPFGITPYYVSLMDEDLHRRRDHAVRAQVIPPMNYVQAMFCHREDREYSFDFMMEHDTSPIDLITRRYPMIAILKPYNTCSQICVYCQRNWEIEDVLAQNALATKQKINEAVDWLADHPGITEILITGGDPLVMRDERLDFVLSRVAELDHVERIRIGSRTLVALPQRITDRLADLIARYHVPGKREVTIVTHFEHPYEITPESLEAVQKFKRRGMSVYNQVVFTIENSRRFELVALRKSLRLIGVDPYYSFNTKGKEETRSYRVPLARLQQEIKEEARLVPGIVRTDEPVYNVPRLGKNYVRAQQHHTLLTILPDGRRVYEFHPWEKNLSLADTFVDTDVSIYEFLQELKRRGEDIREYKTIWYYY